jgi:hypothetical protein
MPTTPASLKDLPLPVRIFRAAMERQRSLADYAQSLDIGADSLRAIVTAQLDHVEPGTLDQLADLYQQPRKTLRDQLSVAPPQESFAAWLKRNMEGISQHALRTRVQLDSKTLKRFLNGEMLPDSDQAERLARALYIDRTELARVVTATMIDQADAAQLGGPAGTGADQLLPSPVIADEQATQRPPRARRRKPTSQAEQASTEATAPNADTTTADTVGEQRAEPSADNARHPSARRQAATQAAAPVASPATKPPIEPLPAPALEHAMPPAGRRTATASAAATERTMANPVEAMASQDNRGAADTASGMLPATKAATQPSTRKRRSAEAIAKPGAEDVASHSVASGEGAAPAGQEAVERDATPPAVAPPIANTATTLASTRPITPSVVAADTTTLELTVDEVRLIRHWRQLHPHGRRATLHYIGSLLVEDY